MSVVSENGSFDCVYLKASEAADYLGVVESEMTTMTSAAAVAAEW